MTSRPVSQARAQHQREAKAQQQHVHRLRMLRRAAVLVAVAVAASLVVYALNSAKPTASSAADSAPAFTLRTTGGGTVSLWDYQGKPVILYFNEGAGCGACTVQMAEIEKDPGFAQAGITVLPIVMNTAEQITPDLERYRVKTPYLLDDGTVSKAYGMLGTGMHEGLPGHGFVLIDGNGQQRWTGNYPSMWLAPADLLQEAKSRLASG